MKKDRNCGMYPTYPMPYTPMNNGMIMPTPMMGMQPDMNMMNQSSMNNQNMMNTSTMNNYNDYNNLTTKINSLEKRVSNLEALVGNNNSTYNTSSFQMM